MSAMNEPNLLRSLAGLTVRNTLIALALIAGLYAGFLWHNKPEVATARFAKQVKRNISATALRTWATNYLAAASANSTNNLSLPDSVIRISSEQQPRPELGHSVSGVLFLQLVFGRGFEHWGLAVGSSDFVLYEGAERYVLEWEPGIYFWRDR